MGEKNMGLPQIEEDIAFVLSTEQHAELISDVLVIENKTSPYHNEVINKISTALNVYIMSNNGSCKVYTENVALFAGELKDKKDNDIFQPDVMVVCDTTGIKDDGVHCAPRLVVEVTSPSTRGHDYNEKRESYRKIGVEEYWIIDIQRHIAIQHLSKEDFVSTFKQGNEIEFSSYPGLKIPVEI